MKIISTLLLLGALLTGAYAQRPRSMDPQPADKAPATPAVKRAPAPKTVKAKYEGGVFGYTKTMEGTLTFDDANNRLLFKDKKPPKEISIPYEAITSAFSDSKKVQPAAATVAQNVPSIYSLPARFIKHKVRYLTLQYSDPDSNVSGITSFKISDKDLLESVLVTLAEKTNMTLRGDVYVKKKPEDSSKATPKQ
ncbi:MAG TPA: hypothetical protein VKB02_05745 [Pyrinomonadaceae bacterium]|nr:hypothetical protein [Pyrinomonadaceae bacterium]